MLGTELGELSGVPSAWHVKERAIVELFHHITDMS
jgi:hypothetical protein